MSDTLADYVNQRLKGLSPFSVVVGTSSTLIASFLLFSALRDGNLFERSKLQIFAAFRKFADPFIQQQIATEAKKIRFPTTGESEVYHTELPSSPLDEKELLKIASEWHERMDTKISVSPPSGVVYHGDRKDSDLIGSIVRMQLWSNPLFADYFGAVRKMEAEVASMMLSLFHAPNDDHCATYTLGGTESIILAMLAYRNQGYERGIRRPNVIVPQTAHPAFDKAAAYLGIKLHKVKVDPKTQRVLLDEVEKYITSETVALVGSAPNYHCGSIDDIQALAAIARNHRVGLHVDACVGGFLIPFYPEAGFQEVLLDFRVPGVTSISCDIHKWGGAPKGASIVLFHSKSLRKLAIFAASSYPGGLYVTQGVSGSKPGYAIAAAWATLLHTGRNSYVEGVREARNAALRFAEQIKTIPGLSLHGSVDATNVAIKSVSFDIYMLQKRMSEKGWRFVALQFPPAIHLGITLEHCRPGVLERIVADLREQAEILTAEYAGKSIDSHGALIYGTSQKIPDRSIIADMLCAYIDRYYANAPQPAVASPH
jgi:sphinganine-1-phosphate aldolase